MPAGTRHDFTGLLTAQGAELILSTEDGRHWRLNSFPGIERYIDQTVRVSGVRGEDGDLFVEAVSQARNGKLRLRH